MKDDTRKMFGRLAVLIPIACWAITSAFWYFNPFISTHHLSLPLIYLPIIAANFVCLVRAKGAWPLHFVLVVFWILFTVRYFSCTFMYVGF